MLFDAFWLHHHIQFESSNRNSLASLNVGIAWHHNLIHITSCYMASQDFLHLHKICSIFCHIRYSQCQISCKTYWISMNESTCYQNVTAAHHIATMSVSVYIRSHTLRPSFPYTLHALSNVTHVTVIRSINIWN